MIVDRFNTMQLTGALHDLKTVNDFIYLGSFVGDDGSYHEEIKRIGISKSATSRLVKIWKDCNNKVIDNNKNKYR